MESHLLISTHFTRDNNSSNYILSASNNLINEVRENDNNSSNYILTASKALTQTPTAMVAARGSLHFLCRCSHAVSGVYHCVCVCLGPVLASRAPSPPAASSASWWGLGQVPISGWSYVGVGPDRGLRGGGRRGQCEEWSRRS